MSQEFYFSKHRLRWQYISFFAILLSTTACMSSYNTWDTDKNHYIEEAEFYKKMTKYHFFKHWDRNKDGVLDNLEISSGSFYVLDANNDGTLDEKEWSVLYSYAYRNKNIPAIYTTWDTNQNGLLNVNEYNKRWEKLFLLNKWDANGDGVWSKAEFFKGLFKMWDVNGDNRIDPLEYRIWQGTWQ